MKRPLQFDEIGYWTEIKLDIIKEYAKAYSTILSRQTKPAFEHIYIDAFAGAGMHLSRRTQEFVPGSPWNALNVRPFFKEYHLIDIDSEKVGRLRALLGSQETYSSMRVTAIACFLRRSCLGSNTKIFDAGSAFSILTACTLTGR